MCGRGAPGWRWLDVRSLATALVAEQSALWPDVRVERVVYCTARIKGNATGFRCLGGFGLVVLVS